ncbi:carbohydrate ABC transporter permease [Gordoniibacillus kamchatkensis]|uniref:carbohydrate ABC transporter permease n=1 Tax=Gordoniibacillus kamchatkensis TaxID=1590651 RepID=UPI000695F3A9|nr:carbohydrate ABC transporter permease [Paenibacillus sp. VKM B-2647]
MNEKRSHRIVLYILAFLVLIYSLFPIYWLTISPLRGENGFFAHSTNLLPTGFDLTFFHNILGETNFPVYYKNSFIVGIAATAITIVIGTLTAYVLTRYRFIGRSMMLNAMLIGYMLPPMLLAIPLLGLFIRLGIDDTLVALIISHISITLPFGVWMLVSFFKTIPFELEESSWVDGASRFTSVARIIFPLMLPGVISVAVFSFIVSFTDYTFGLMIVSSDANKNDPGRTCRHQGFYLAAARGHAGRSGANRHSDGSLILVRYSLLY